MIYMFFVGYIIGGIVGAFILACILLANKMCVVIKEKNKDEEIKALTKANENLKVLYQDIVTQSEWHDEDYKKEIERLKEENNILCSIANGEKEKEEKILELYNRIEEAIEYIEKNCTERGEGKWTYRTINADNTLNILEGVDKE